MVFRLYIIESVMDKNGKFKHEGAFQFILRKPEIKDF